MNRRTMAAAMVFGGTAMALGHLETRPRSALAGGWATLELINPVQIAIVDLPMVIDVQVLQHGVSPSSYFPAVIRFVHEKTGEEIVAKLEFISEVLAIARGEVTLPDPGLYRMYSIDMGPELEIGQLEAVQPSSGDIISQLLSVSNSTDEATGNAVADVTTDILDASFADPVLEVAAGSIIQWTNTSVLMHQVMFHEGSIPVSPMLHRNDSFKLKFDQPGEYTYICAPHPGMTGLVRVL